MHYHCEVYLEERPENIFETVSKIMEPYFLILPDEDDEYNPNGFWDWFVIGGRWSGAHTEMLLDQEKLKQFYKICDEKELFWVGPDRPAEVQEAKRKEEFLKLFPDFKGIIPTCRDTYRIDGYSDDIIEVEKVTEHLSCYTLILPDEVLHTEIWDGNKFCETHFDGCVKHALDERGITTGYLVTVDYHS